MKEVKKGESHATSTKVDGEKVLIRHVTLNKPSRTSFELSWTFDFAGVSTEQLKELAAKGLVIAARPKFKKEKERAKLKEWDNKTFTVKEMLGKAKRKVDKVTKAKVALSTLSDEEKAELLKMLKAGANV